MQNLDERIVEEVKETSIKAVEKKSPIKLVYFSSTSNNTKRFIEKTELNSVRLPLYGWEDEIKMTEEYILVTPTYGAGKSTGAVPKQVLKFLKDENNRNLCKGVIGGGNTNFGSGYVLAARKIAAKLNVPLLYKFEVFGQPADVEKVKEIVENLGKIKEVVLS